MAKQGTDVEKVLPPGVNGSNIQIQDEGWATDLFTGQGLESLGNVALGALPFAAPVGLAAAGIGAVGGAAGAAGLEAAGLGGAAGLAPEAVGAIPANAAFTAGEVPGSMIPSWFGSVPGFGEPLGYAADFVGPTLEQAGLESFVGPTFSEAASPLADLGLGTAAAGGGYEATSGLGTLDLGDLGGGTGGLTDAGGAAAKESFLSKLGTGAMDSLTKNPLGIAAAGIGLGMNMLKKPSMGANADKLQAQAAQLGAQGQVLRDYLATGTLPPGLQAKLDQATQAAKARIIANHAKNGMNTDPAQNSALAQELNAVDINAVAAMADAQVKMLHEGINETGLSSQLYQALLKMDREDQHDLMNAIANFSAALGGASTIKKAA